MNPYTIWYNPALNTIGIRYMSNEVLESILHEIYCILPFTSVWIRLGDL